MTGDKALLSHFEERVGPQITFGDDKQRFHYGIWQFGSWKCHN